MISRRWGACVVVITSMLLVSCDPATAPEAKDYDFGGPCVTESSSEAVVGDVALTIDVVPAAVSYGTTFAQVVTVENLSDDVLQVGAGYDDCLGWVWLRGVDPLYDRTCGVFGMTLLPHSRSNLNIAGLFRATGEPYATPTVPGIRANPNTYCFSVEFTLPGDTVLLERPFVLLPD